jgi:hypothetical protein
MKKKETEMESWNQAAKYAVDRIYGIIVDADGTDVTRHWIDEIIDKYYESPVNHPYLINLWEMLGSSAISLSVEFDCSISSEYVVQTLIRKQSDYGHENIRRFGRQGLIIRCHDKVARLENLCGGDFDPQNESIQDTLLDIIGYSAIGMMWEEGTFLLPLKRSQKKSPEGVANDTTRTLELQPAPRIERSDEQKLPEENHAQLDLPETFLV